MKMKSARRRPAGVLIALCQLAIAKPVTLYLRSRGGYHADYSRLTHLNQKTRYVIAANHQSMLDPFAIFAALPKRLHSPLAPLKFMTNPSVYHKWYLKPLMFSFGCYPAHTRQRNHHTYGVSGSVKLLDYGYNICIFPEGRRTLREESDPKPGVCKILQDYPDAKLLLAHLEWTTTKRGKKHFCVTVAAAPDSLNLSNPKSIMEAIYAL